MNNCIKLMVALGLSASVAFAHETLNKTGLLGINKTQSAQSLKHGQLAFSLLADVTNDGGMVDGEYTNWAGGLVCTAEDATCAAGGTSTRDKFTGLATYVAASFGLFEIADIAIMLPVYYDQTTFNDGDAAKKGGVGNLRANLKLRAPLPKDQIFDIALVLGGDFGTASESDQGAWIHEPDYINTDNGIAYAYGNRQTIFRATFAATMDLRKIDAAPLLIHLNGGYRLPIGGDYDSFYTFSTALEVYPLPVVSIFGEFYMDIPNGSYIGDALDLMEASFGLVFHIGKHVDFQVGGHVYIGGDNYLTVSGAYGHADGTNVWYGDSKLIPSIYGFGGITVSAFLIDEDRDGDGVVDDKDKCPDEPGDPKNEGCPWGEPDIDEDGVCDSWVAEKGLLDQFADICEGIDKCPNEPGEGEDGCPLDDPDPDQDGVCDVWVSQKGYQDAFADVCSGIDNCPGQPGPESNMGCPEDNPDADGDGICDPWVSQKNRLDDFAAVCKGYDNCPGQAGPDANQGCPWPDPDSDGDGLCDEWVTAKQMGYFFENAETLNDPYITKSCKALDKCPYEYGPAWNNGCPAQDPDPDHDGVCDSWVSAQGLLEQFADVCTGVDKCPLDSGSVDADGCKLDDPDMDKDGVCDPWVTQKGMLEKFAEVCTGLDKCPYDAGDKDNNGCPLDDPDFDKDGVCDPWVAQKNMLAKFEGVCSGIDKCPLDYGSPDFGGCAAPKVEKLDGVTFKSGKAVLESNAKKVLKKVAQKLNDDPVYQGLNIVIQGHTDNQGKAAKNQKLSEQRATSVMNFLVQSGLDKSRVQVVGCGDTAPVASNKTADGREENRRIEMHFVSPEDDGMKCEATYVEE